MGEIERVAPRARVWITEFASAHVSAIAPFAQLPALRKHPPVDLDDGLAHTATLLPETKFIRLVSEIQFAFSTTGEATVDDILVPRHHVEYFGTAPEDVEISMIAAP
jgi:hypothetical protein